MILIVFLEIKAEAAKCTENNDNLHQKVAQHHHHHQETDCDVITVVCVRN